MSFFKQVWIINKSEFKSKWTGGVIIGILVAILIPQIGPLASGAIEVNPQEALVNPLALQRATMAQIGRIFAEGLLYSLGFRLFSVLKDKTTLDKNRASYLAFSKGKVLFAKIFADVMLFALTIALTVTIGIVTIINKNGGEVSDDFYSRVAMYMVGAIIFYAITSYGMRIIQAALSEKSKVVSGFALAGWILATMGVYVVLSIVTGVVKGSETVMVNGAPVSKTTWPIQQFFVDNKLIISLIPFANIPTISLVLYGSVPLCTIVPIIGYSLIAIGLTWNKMASLVKEYLCA